MYKYILWDILLIFFKANSNSFKKSLFYKLFLRLSQFRTKYLYKNSIDDKFLYKMFNCN